MLERIWEKIYFDRKTFLLEENDRIKLNPTELVVLLYIEHFNQSRQAIDLNLLASKMQINTTQIDQTMTGLIQRGFISLDISDTGVNYRLDGVYQFEDKVESTELKSLVDMFGDEFKRPLTSNETEKLDYWLIKCGYDYVVHALREAVIYRQLKFPYIDRILNQWLKDELTLDDLNAGKRNAK